MNRQYYCESIDTFLSTDSDAIIGKMAINNDFSLEQSQRYAWLEEISLLKTILKLYHGTILFEYSIPRMGKRIDVVLIIGPVIFVLEFKVGSTEFNASAIDQVMDYALDLKNFHEISHEHYIAPILISTHAQNKDVIIATTPHNDKLISPIISNSKSLELVI